MEKVISAADAHRKFSRVLRDVRKGQTYMVTSHGKAVACISPFKEDHANAQVPLLNRLRDEPVARIGRWSSDKGMVRAFNLLASLPGDLALARGEKDPQKRKRL